MTEWFERWFDADDYLVAYRKRDERDAARLIDAILERVTAPPDPSALDMACGAGRHSLLLAERGFQVVGVDLSAKLLEAARADANKRGLEIEFLRRDLRGLRLARRFDLALNAFTSFGYFSTDAENFALFRIAEAHLAEGGTFAFDFMNAAVVERNLRPLTRDEWRNKRITHRRRVRNGRVEKTITVEEKGETREYLESVKLYRQSELDDALRSAGFGRVEWLGDYAGAPFRENESPRAIALCRRGNGQTP
jgi:SAM-dependent methyltransferase